MELLIERGIENYGEIADPGFRSFLAELGKLLEENVRRWPMRIASLPHYPYTQAFRLKAADMNWLLVDVRRKGIMDPVHSSAIHRSTEPDYFDKGRCLAFGALARVIVEEYGRNEKGFADITGSRDTFPWDLFVAEAKFSLGEHPLTELLHHANGRPETISAPQPRRRRHVVTKRPVLPEVPIIVDGKQVIIKDKFPVFDQEGKVSVEKMDIHAVASLLTHLPGNPLDEVNPVHHAPEPVIQAVMFILKANSYNLASYKQYKEPYEEQYSLLEFRSGLELCLKYLTRYTNIRNVYQLVKSVERAVLSDPLKYWKKSADPGSG